MSSRVVVTILLFSAVTIEAKEEVRFVSVVFRHGNRAPQSRVNDLYPNDPYLNNSFYPMGLGGLTNEGKRNEYKLGQELRKRYNNFLGDVYIPEDIEARSTDVPRTKMSLSLVLAGLYPPTRIQKWNRELNWQPIPINHVPNEQDILFLAEDACPRYVEELERVNSLPEVMNMVEEFRPLMKKLTSITGKRMNSIVDLWFMYHGLMSKVSLNLRLPEWTDELFPDGPLRDATILTYEIYSYNDLLKRLNTGLMLKVITNDMMAVANGNSKPPRKINLFSGHELNIAAILISLGLYKPHVPEYSSAVIIELVCRNENYYVKILHYLGIPSVFEEQEIPNCGKLCPLDKFIDLIKNLTAIDEKTDCIPKTTT